MPTIIRDLLESAADCAAGDPQDWDVAELLEALEATATENTAYAREARRLASRVRDRLDA